jgi:glycosyltransferase involved in cell wall biosynthesis
MTKDLTVLADARWDGDTGIGRVYREIEKRTPSRIKIQKVTDNFSLGHPLSPLLLAKQVKDHHCDVFWSPSFMPPFQPKVPAVITVHDVLHLYFYSKAHAFYMRYFLAPLFKKLSTVITVSEFTKKLLLDELGLSEHLVTVVYNGVDDSFFANDFSLKLDRPYVLYVGNRRSYKNLERMMEAFAKASISRDTVFAISGDPSEHLEKKIAKIGLKDRVYFLGHIDEKSLPGVYKGASALFYMSLMEGFGLPVIEAMASGTPVVTSNTSSLSEISAGAAALCDPYNIEGMATKLELVLNDINYRAELQEKGFRNAKRFSWENTARQTWEIVQRSVISH